ncbi:DNA primase [Candidatus Peregrinibacteria bacterium CG11_big_fil_rev_8_21_14_0_20_49_14]|nr:MAG: DNA primase [Candidatus Peregrinibacteria bacterium CG11_big_fil_rev_8_21_14_0_20_49_14]
MSSSMDPVFEIKARLPIEELVGQYCSLSKKGKHLKCVCPFHNDTHPSMLVSPDKGIAYCFACNSGGDIFGFYQKIEGVDFHQALRDLGERTGVDVSEGKSDAVKKDVKDRLRDCLEAAQLFYIRTLRESAVAKEYVKKRGIPAEQQDQFGIGFAPDSFSETYEYLLKQGFSKTEILDAGLGVQKDLSEGRIYDRFRNRLMFPIHDHQGKIVAFGGRTLGDDDAKYINSSEGPLYHKSAILYGFHYAKDSMRLEQKVVVVEGYFDVLACHRVGVTNVVAASGTAFTVEHVKLLKRYVEKIVLCLDQDTAGRKAAESAFHLASVEGLHVHTAFLPEKDPDETAAKEPGLLQRALQEEDIPYLEAVIQELQKQDLSSVQGKRLTLKTLLPLIDSITLSVEKSHYISTVASLLGTTETTLKEDIARLPRQQIHEREHSEESPGNATVTNKNMFSSMEIALALFVLYPANKSLFHRLIHPEGEREEALFMGIREAPESSTLTVDMLDMPEDVRDRLRILLLYLEDHGMGEWSENIAMQEMVKNCTNANREFLQRKQRDIAKKLMHAKSEGRTSDEAQLATQYQQVLKLAKMAG